MPAVNNKRREEGNCYRNRKKNKAKREIEVRAENNRRGI
jgi:hypothetical protein